MDVSVRDGAATLSGMAESNEAKGKAMLMAGNIHCTGASSANREVIQKPDLILFLEPGNSSNQGDP